MNEEIIQRLENLEQRINLLQASCESLSCMLAQLLVQQSVVEVARTTLTPEQFGQNISLFLDGYAKLRDQKSSKLSEWPFLPPEPPPSEPSAD